MSISAEQMKGAPEWATRYEMNDDDSAGWFVRDLTRHVDMTTIDGAVGGSAQLVLENGRPFVVDGPTGESWADPSELRKLAAHLLNAADEWDKIRNAEMRREMAGNLARLMDQRGVDVAGLADRMEINAERVEAWLDMSKELNVTEVAIICHIFGVDPSEMLPARFSS
ncbi:helix-turn-helix domain-containing protein [Demequina oxidasica]|uniref:helix-turn-helix domain-containing protein n=1 Tax=Demequina oxidasica TaxID=676199 RepID=UPI000782BE4F|nr:helix-turn-helix transcriptional regulator [Demequina oxidasica]